MNERIVLWVPFVMTAIAFSYWSIAEIWYLIIGDGNEMKKQKNVTYELKPSEYPLTCTGSEKISVGIGSASRLTATIENGIIKLDYGCFATRAQKHQGEVLETKFCVEIINGKLVVGLVPGNEIEIYGIE